MESVITIIGGVILLIIYIILLLDKLHDSKKQKNKEKLEDELYQMRYAYNDKIQLHLHEANNHLHHASRLAKNRNKKDD